MAGTPQSSPIVDHLLRPHVLVKHPNDDESVLVARRQLSVVGVPCNAHDPPLVSLEGLVHGEVGGSRDTPGLGGAVT